MSLFIINRNDGTVTDLDGCYVVDINELDEDGKKSWQEWEDGGNSGDSAKVAQQGKDLVRLLSNCGYGDLTFSNCIAFTPKSLKEEAGEQLQYTDKNDPDYPGILWASEAEVEQLQGLVEYVINDDTLWSEYHSTVMSGIREFYNNEVKEKVGK